MFYSKKNVIAILVICALFVVMVVWRSADEGKSQTLHPEWEEMAEEHSNLIRVSSPEIAEKVSSPLIIEGEARGYWFFEATFPIVLTDWDGKIIAQGYAEAQDEWMTEEFVPFTTSLDFEVPEYGERGFLILQKANASDLPEHDDALEVIIYFK